MAFPAKYPGLCKPCGDDIEAGQMITNHLVVGYVHEDCVHDVDRVIQVDGEEPDPFGPGRVPTHRVLPRGKTAQDKCMKCFMVHSPGQDGCE